MRGSGDPHRAATVLAGFIGHIPVPARFAAVCDCANRLSCRFVDVDPEDALEGLCPGHGLATLGHRLLLECTPSVGPQVC